MPFGFGKKRKSDGAKPVKLTEHTSTPPALQTDGDAKFAEIWGSASVGSQRMFVVTVLSLILAIIAVATLAAVFPLKTIAAFAVEIDSSRGVVNKPVLIEKVTPPIAVVKAELARWAEAVYTIDSVRTNDLFKFANSRARGKAIAQFADFRAREQVFPRLQREPGLAREVQVTSVDATQPGVAFLFLKTIERNGNQRIEDAIIKRHRITLHYTLESPTDEASLLANPLGTYVTFFNEVEERSN